ARRYSTALRRPALSRQSISACRIALWACKRRLWPRPMILPSRTNTDPIGIPPSANPCRASAIAPCRKGSIAEARQGLAEGGIPIGSVLVLDGKIIGRGHNQRVQKGSVIHHAEMNCLENAGRLPASVYKRCILYSTLSPCPMCSGTVLLYKI